MTLTDEQREEIQTRWYKDPTLISSAEKVAKQALLDVRALLASEQAWREENADTDRALLETLDKVHDLEGEINEVKFQLNQATEVLKELRRITPYGMYHEMIDPVLSSISQEKEETT